MSEKRAGMTATFIVSPVPRSSTAPEETAEAQTAVSSKAAVNIRISRFMFGLIWHK